MESVRRDTKRVGDVAEAMVLAALVRAGYHVSIPWGENNRYDLIFESEDAFARVQVKSGRLRLGVIWFNCYSTHVRRGRASHRSYCGEVEYFGVYCRDNDGTYLVPANDVAATRGALRLATTKNAQIKGVRWAADYLVSATTSPPGRNVAGARSIARTSPL
jgi:hypothetical protein